ncbi:MAG: exodeoxyribonuclease III [Methanomicrobiaceae archaeon]|nr:exodeoxyribonuclease III [Methanomicrobiaceae archaeon]
MIEEPSVRLISWNVNGLRAILKKGFLEFVAREQPDILCIQETKLQEEQLPAEVARMPGYRIYLASAERRGYSGVAMLSRTAPEWVERGFGTRRFDTEGRILIAGFPDFDLYTIYFPNGKASDERLRYKLDFYDGCLDRMKKSIEDGREVVLCGDVNTAHAEIDLARPMQNRKVSGFLPEERAWIDRLIAEGFVDTFRMVSREGGHYTWWDQKSRARERNVGWRIDYFLVSEGLAGSVATSSIHPEVMGSDHCPISLVLDGVHV